MEKVNNKKRKKEDEGEKDKRVSGEMNKKRHVDQHQRDIFSILNISPEVSGKKFRKLQERLRVMSAPPAVKVPLPTPTRKINKTKGIRGVLRARKPLQLERVPEYFQTPEPVVLNEYWVYFPIPQKALFRKILELPPLSEPPAAPDVSDCPHIYDALAERQVLEGRDGQLEQQQTTLLKEISVLEKDNSRAQELSDMRTAASDIALERKKLDAENQMKLFTRSRAKYFWEKQKDLLEKPVLDYHKAENERKADVLSNINHGLGTHMKHINSVQKNLFEVELEKAAENAGGKDGKVPDIQPFMSFEQKDHILTLKERVAIALKKVQESSVVKVDISTTQSATKSVVKPLKRHLPSEKGKYERSGKFTKESRAKKEKSARPYKKSGRHINDFLNPRFPKQRDQQIVERAELLGVSPEEFRRSVMGKN